MTHPSPRKYPDNSPKLRDRAPTPEVDEAHGDLESLRLRQGQLFLAALGYGVAGERDPAGATDGVFGHHTRGAILQFQSDRGLEANGHLDEPTWEALSAAHEEGCEALSSAPTTDEGDAALAAGEQTSAGIHESASDVLVELAAPELSEEELDMLEADGDDAAEL